MMSKVNNIAHRLVPLCLLLVALAGCRKEDTPAPDTPSGTPIAFTPETATKAAVSGKEDIQNDPNGFRVWSWFQGTTSGPMFGADGTQVTYDTATSAWTYSPTRYWMNGTYDFAAIYPAAITTGEGEAATTTKIAGTYAPATSGGTPVLTVPNFDATTQADLLVAFNNGTDGTGINGATPPDAVDLTFQHALSNIQLILTLNEDDFFVDAIDENGNPILDENGNPRKYPTGYAKVSIVGFNKIATVGTLTSIKSTDTINCEWASTNFNSEFKFNYTAAPIQVTLTGEKVFGENGMFVIPQYLANASGELYMQVVIESPGIADTITKEFMVPLKAGVSEWLPNTKYIYRGEITRQLVIDFSVTRINDWEDETLGGFIVS